MLTRNHLSRDGSGIGIEKARHNLVACNVVVDPRHRGISLGLDFAKGLPSAASQHRPPKRGIGSDGDGFLVNAKGTSVLRRNVASGAKDDGFAVESRSTSLAKNARRTTRTSASRPCAGRSTVVGRRPTQRRPPPVHAHRVR